MGSRSWALLCCLRSSSTNVPFALSGVRLSGDGRPQAMVSSHLFSMSFSPAGLSRWQSSSDFWQDGGEDLEGALNLSSLCRSFCAYPLIPESLGFCALISLLLILSPRTDLNINYHLSLLFSFQKCFDLLSAVISALVFSVLLGLDFYLLVHVRWGSISSYNPERSVYRNLRRQF